MESFESQALFEIFLVLTSTFVLINRLSLMESNFWGRRYKALLICIPFMAISVKRVLSLAYVPDETAFLSFAHSASIHKMNLPELLFAPNLEGFGSMFWSTIGVAIKVTSFFSNESEWPNDYNYLQIYDDEFMLDIYSIQLVRAIGLLTVLLWFRMFVRETIDNQGISKYLPLLVLTFPIMWWGGKVSSPELICAGLAGMSGIHVSRGNNARAILFASLAAGFKVSAIPVLLCVLLVSVLSLNQDSKLNNENTLKKISRLLFLSLFPYLALNMYVFTEPKDFFSNLLNRLAGQSLAIDFSYLDLEIMQVLSHPPIWTWDYVTMSGLFYWWGSALMYFALMSLLLINRQYIYLFLFTAVPLLTAFSLLISGAQLYGYLYFPSVLFSISLLSRIELGKSKFRRDYILTRQGCRILVLILFVAAAQSLNGTLRERTQVLAHERDLNNLPVSMQCIVSATTGAENLFDLGVIGKKTVFTETPPYSFPLFEDNDLKTLIVGGRSLMALQGDIYSNPNIVVDSSERCGSFMIIKVHRN
jgi:hypothetical protein